MKCEVLERVCITVEKGSIVEVDPRQFEVAKRYLKPVELKKETKAKKK